MFKNRKDAGRKLAGALAEYKDKPDVLVIGLPRGGVPVAGELAKELHLPLDVCLVRKLRVPTQPELAFGAVSLDEVVVLNDTVVAEFGIDKNTINSIAEKEGREIKRRNKLYRRGRAAPEISGKSIILVDDGLATGATMRAAVQAVNAGKPAEVVVAVPVGPAAMRVEFEADVDRIIILETPKPFSAVGQGYKDFSQVTDEEVQSAIEHGNKQKKLKRF